MKLHLIGILLGYLVLGTTTQLLLKISAHKSIQKVGVSSAISIVGNGWFVGALVIYVVMLGLYMVMLRQLPLSIAYLLTAATFATVPVASYFILKERLTWEMMVGCALIVIGVVLIARQGD